MRASDVLASLIPLDFYTTKMRYLEALTKGTPFVLYDSHRHGVADLIDRFKVTAIYGTVMHAENLLQSLPASTQARHGVTHRPDADWLDRLGQPAPAHP